MGLVYSYKDDFQMSMSFYQKALNIQKIALPSKNLELATTHRNIGALYHSYKKYENAILNYKKAIVIFIKNEIKIHFDVVDLYNHLGLAYYGMNNIKKAIFYLERAITMAKKLSISDHTILLGVIKNLQILLKNISQIEPDKYINWHRNWFKKECSQYLTE